MTIWAKPAPNAVGVIRTKGLSELV
jgi:hypothetical protein